MYIYIIYMYILYIYIHIHVYIIFINKREMYINSNMIFLIVLSGF